MRLAAKLVLLFFCGLLLIVALLAYHTIKRDRQRAIEDHQRLAAEVAKILSHRQDLSTGFASISTRRIQIRQVEFQSSDDRLRPSVPQAQIVVSKSITTVPMPNPDGGETFYTYLPINDADRDDNSRLEISSPDEHSQTRMRRALQTSLIAVASVTGISGIVILLGGFVMVGKPLNQLVEKVNRVAEGDFEGEVHVQSHDELGTLARAINEMSDKLLQQRKTIEDETAKRISAMQQLRHADRLRSVGRMAAGIAHEMGTPLNVISGRAEMIANDEMPASSVRASAAAIKSETQRIATIVSGMLDFARQSPPNRAEIDLRTVASETAELLTPIAKQSKSMLHLSLPDQPVIAFVDASQVQQVLTNLINNALASKKVEPRENVRVDVSIRSASTESSEAPKLSKIPGFCEIVVTDNGDGITAEDLEHVFEPFFTTKQVGEGTGLGLSIAHGIVKEHGGSIEVESTPGEGSKFRVMLPALKT